MSRTRGILGGTSLVTAGVPNEVYVLWNGTRGWLLEGLVLERGATRFATAPSPQARQRARERASNLARRAGIRSIDRATLEQWRNDTTQTTYVFDVRDRDEYEAGHLAGACNAPEGSLVMGPDHYMGTQHARCVLVDDDMVRVTIAALWLSQMGRCTPYVLDDASRNGARTSTDPGTRQRPERDDDAAGARCPGAPCQSPDHRCR
jgi:rhodanese-related sulfurtransferase